MGQGTVFYFLHALLSVTLTLFFPFVSFFQIVLSQNVNPSWIVQVKPQVGLTDILHSEIKPWIVRVEQIIC